MKKVLIVLTSISVYSLLLAGCQKQNSVLPDKGKEKSFIEAARDFFEREVLVKNFRPADAVLNRKSILKKPDWKQAYVQHAGDVKKVIVPVRYEKRLSIKSATGEDDQLLLDNQTSLVISVSGSAGYTAEVVTWIPGKFLTGNTGHYSDYILIEDWAGNSLARYLVKDGKTYRAKPKDAVASNRMEQSSCIHINWFLCDISAGGSVMNCEFLFSEDIGCDQGFAVIADSGTDCVIADESKNATVTADQVMESYTSLDDFKTSKTIRWRIFKGPTWSLHSIENGVVKYIEAECRWEWVKLVHEGIVFEGYSPGFKISYSQGVGRSSYVEGTPGVYFALMALSFSVTFAPSGCLGIPIPSLIPTYSRTYYSHIICGAKSN